MSDLRRSFLASGLLIALLAACNSADESSASSESNLDVSSTNVIVGGLPIAMPLTPDGHYAAMHFDARSTSQLVVSVRGKDNAAPSVILSQVALDGTKTEVARGQGVIRATLENTGSFVVEIDGESAKAVTSPTIAVAAFVPLVSTDDVGTTWEFPHTGSEAWRALAPMSTGNVWVTGDSAVMHWNHGEGKRYRLLDEARLGAIWAAADNDVWVGGAKLFHFDGTQWFEVVRPASMSTGQLNGMSSSDVWQTVSGLDRVSFIRWNGERWYDATATSAGAGSGRFAIASSTEAYLFGGSDDWASVYNGTKWTRDIDRAEAFYSPSDWATDASPLATDLGTAVIFGTSTQGDVRVRDAAGVWHAISSFAARYPLGLTYGGGNLQSVWGTSASRLWVTERNNGKDVFRRSRDASEKDRAGGEWLNVPSAVHDAFVRGLPDGTAWFAGANGQLGSTKDVDRVVAVTEAGPTCAALMSTPRGGSAVWAGCENTIYRKGGDTWSTYPVTIGDKPSPITALWSDDYQTFFALADGTIAVLQVNDLTMTKIGSFPGTSFRFATGSSAQDVTFAAQGGLVHWNGTALAPIDLGRTDLGPVHTTYAERLFVGAGKTVLHFDGNVWTPSLELADRVEQLTGGDPNEIYASSQNDLVRWDGHGWAKVAWRDSSPVNPNARITSITGTHDVVVTTSDGYVGTRRGGGAFVWVKRPVIVTHSVLTDDANGIVATAATGGIVTVKK